MFPFQCLFCCGISHVSGHPHGNLHVILICSLQIQVNIPSFMGHDLKSILSWEPPRAAHQPGWVDGKQLHRRVLADGGCSTANIYPLATNYGKPPFFMVYPVFTKLIVNHENKLTELWKTTTFLRAAFYFWIFFLFFFLNFFLFFCGDWLNLLFATF